MRRNRIHFHHVEGQLHANPHGVGDSAGSGQRTRQLLEYLYNHNEEHRAELAGYCDDLGDCPAAIPLSESVALLGQSNEKLHEALTLLERA